MTATELQNIARVLSNQAWVRYWLNYYDTRHSVDLAIHVTDFEGKPQRVPELERKGFRRQDAMGLKGVYVIQRTNEDGTPFESKVV